MRNRILSRLDIRSFSSNYNIQNFDKRLFTRLFNHPHYDKYNSIRLDDHVFQSALEKEKRNALFFKERFKADHLLEEILEETSGRTDSRIINHPEKIGDRYFTVRTTNTSDGSYSALFGAEREKGPFTNVFDPKLDQVVPEKYINTHEINSANLSDSGDYLSIVLDIRSDENTTAFIKDLKNRRMIPGRIDNCSKIEFLSDNQSLLYIYKDPKTLRKDKIFYKDIHDTFGNRKELIFEENDESVWVDLAVSTCKQFFILYRTTKEGEDFFLAPRTGVTSAKDILFTKIADKSENISDVKINKKGLVFAQNGMIKWIKIDKLHAGLKEDSKKSVEERFEPVTLLGDHLKLKIKEFDFFEHGVLVFCTKVSESILLYGSFEKENSEDIIFKEISFAKDQFGSIQPGVNSSALEKKAQFSFDSPFVYNEEYSLDLDTLSIKMLSTSKIKGKPFNRKNFEVSLIYAPSKDGQSIPITLIHPRGAVKKDGKFSHFVDTHKKLMLCNYGCYGLDNSLEFNLTDWSLLERGWMIALAHVRGGGELGVRWHRDATRINKYKSVDDLISCAQYLIAEGYTHPSLLCASGESAGATILASAMNSRPNLFKAVQLGVPFLDLRASLLDITQPLTQSDFSEFGNPLENEAEYLSITSLCPLTNLKEREYPAVLIQANSDDMRTPLDNVLKYSAKFRDTVKEPKKIKEFNEKNIIVSISEGSHLGTGSSTDAHLQNAKRAVFFEHIIESLSNDLR